MVKAADIGNSSSSRQDLRKALSEWQKVVIQALGCLEIFSRGHFSMQADLHGRCCSLPSYILDPVCIFGILGP